MQCQKCRKEVFLPFKCPYCEEYFCSEHRLPENHNCPQIEQAHMPKQETQKPYEYTISYIPVEKSRKTKFSNTEIKHLVIAAALVIGVGLSIGTFSEAYADLSEPIMLVTFATILTASFFIHEISHKITAQKKGLWAEFRLTIMGAVLTLFSIILPFFKIISPGAVMVAGFADRENLGKISIAGPITNIALSSIFLAMTFAVQEFAPQYAPVFMLSSAINAWIALFNLIPFGILDGFKIFQWDKKIWALAFTPSLILTLASYGFLT